MKYSIYLTCSHLQPVQLIISVGIIEKTGFLLSEVRCEDLTSSNRAEEN